VARDYPGHAVPMVQVNVRIPPDLHDKVMTEADRDGATITAVVTRALHEHFNRAGRRPATEGRQKA
jgi:predicted HicB family RNase H-like nuclease